ncbi:MAG: zinc ribbon domain-containing protein [Thermoflexales bacterium]|nr:zinc ribbon domain-containing protein [Thermoflexales bacterium]
MAFFRRRPLGRPLRRLFPPPPVPPKLLQANRLLASGDYPAAAEALEQLAQGAERRGLPQAAPLYLQAGHARILAGDTPTGMGSLRRGLALFVYTGRLQRAHRAGERIVAELRARGLTAEAEEMATYLWSLLPAGSPAAGPEPSRRTRLPTHCPACGAPLRPDETDWLDEVTAECPYCGSPVRGTE